MHKSKALLLDELSESSVIQFLLIFWHAKLISHGNLFPVNAPLATVQLEFRAQRTENRAGISNFALLDKPTLSFSWILESGGLGLKM